MGRLGAHVSSAGGVSKAWPRAAEIGCDAIQVFVKNASTWRAKPLAAREVTAFRAARDATPGHGTPAPMPVVAHASYLINLASPVEENLTRSRAALADELLRCSELGVDALVVHPGAHMGEGEAMGLAAIARSLDAVFAEHPGITTRLLLENTAGQGTVLGSTPAQLGAIVAAVDERQRLGVCLDTCHAFAAGVDLRADDGYDAFLEAIDAAVGLARVEAWHLNDSKGALGTRKDRHASIGQGEMGVAPFERLLGDERFAGIAMILETPLGDDGQGHARDLVTLRALTPRPASARR
jgi:deoxyribonuclease IV